MLPALKKIHKDENDFSAAMKRHLEFVNMSPYFAPFMMGIVLAMEEKRENHALIRATKVALIGPLGGIGDVLFHFSLLPIAASIGASLAMEGNILGPITFLIMFNVVLFIARISLRKFAYVFGLNAIEKLNDKTKEIEKGMGIVGTLVSGGLIASYVRLTLPYEFEMGEQVLSIQKDVLDKISPNLLPLGYTVLMYLLLKKKVKPLNLILITISLGLFLGLTS